MAEKTAPKPNMIGMTDFLFSFCGEKKPGDGEDSYAYALQEHQAMLGVFDGCGGSGAVRRPAPCPGRRPSALPRRIFCLYHVTNATARRISTILFRR